MVQLNRSGLERPPFPINPADDLVGLRNVGGLEAVGVPQEFLAGAIGHIPKVIRLGEPP